MTMHVVEVRSGQEVIATVTEYAGKVGIKRGSISSLIGAIGSCTISNMPTTDAKSDIIADLEYPMEMSGTGEINDGVPHIHCVVSGEGNAALAGHLHAAHVTEWFVRVYISAVG